MEVGSASRNDVYANAIESFLKSILFISKKINDLILWFFFLKYSNNNSDKTMVKLYQASL